MIKNWSSEDNKFFFKQKEQTLSVWSTMSMHVICLWDAFAGSRLSATP